MVGSRKKAQLKAARERDAKKSSDPVEQEKIQHEANTANAGAFVSHAITTVRTMGVDRALTEILETVHHWPSEIDKVGLNAFIPAFNATEISAKEVQEDDDLITSVTFTYSGKRYDFVSRIKEGSSSTETLGTIALDENGKWAINLDMVKFPGQAHFNFRELNAFRLDTWIEKILQIESEIRQHHEEMAGKTD